jgi:hypothetical protein
LIVADHDRYSAVGIFFLRTSSRFIVGHCANPNPAGGAGYSYATAPSRVREATAPGSSDLEYNRTSSQAIGAAPSLGSEAPQRNSTAVFPVCIVDERQSVAVAFSLRDRRLQSVGGCSLAPIIRWCCATRWCSAGSSRFVAVS